MKRRRKNSEGSCDVKLNSLDGVPEQTEQVTLPSQSDTPNPVGHTNFWVPRQPSPKFLVLELAFLQAPLPCSHLEPISLQWLKSIYIIFFKSWLLCGNSHLRKREIMEILLLPPQKWEIKPRYWLQCQINSSGTFQDANSPKQIALPCLRF